jgi:L-lactate dehydrogenase complex protein LldG
MSTGNTAQEAILQRIRAALRDVPPAEQPEDVAVAGNYRHSGTETREEMVERFIERVAEYKVTVQRVEEGSLPQAIATACTARGVHRLVIPADLPEDWFPPNIEQFIADGLSEASSVGHLNIELLRDSNTLTYEQLDASDGVLTGCELGIAQTGTIVLNGGAHQGRRAITLLPDYHLCVVYADQIVDLVPEAIARLYEAVLREKRPITFISGPSATSDIELTRVEGVHGPRTLHVLVVHGR